MKQLSAFFLIFYLTSSLYSDTFLQKGLNFYKQKKFLLAIGQFKKALDNPKAITEAHFYLGNCYLNNGNIEKAAQHYQKALTSTSDMELQSQILFNLGESFHLKGDFQTAITNYRKAYSLNPRLSQSFWLIGMAYYSLRQKDQVISSWENYLTLKPNGKQSANIRKALEILKATNFTFPIAQNTTSTDATNANKEKLPILDIEGVLDQIQPADKGKVTDDELEDIVK